MSPELEALEQLLGGDLPLPVILNLFGDDGRFIHGIIAMLAAGEVRLLRADGTEVPYWRWSEVLAGLEQERQEEVMVAILSAGLRRIE